MSSVVRCISTSVKAQISGLSVIMTAKKCLILRVSVEEMLTTQTNAIPLILFFGIRRRVTSHLGKPSGVRADQAGILNAAL